MKNTENFKTLWWGILVVVIGFYLFGRYDQLIEGKPSYFDVVVFLVWVGVSLAPIFQEMDIFGVKLKQQVDELRKDLSYQLSILKTEIKSSIDVSSANQNNISVNTSQEPPKDSEIPQLKEEINKILQEKGIVNTTGNQLPAVDDVSVELFKVRLAFEKLVMSYTYDNRPMISSDGRRRNSFSLGRVINELRKLSPISPDVLGGVSEVISICNYAIHGEKPSENQLDFVRSSSSNLYQALESEFRTHYL
ncbi:hypothetical protein [Photobacterium alginatilyticum]|uniref:DUF4145 domain-containing protein n=1 Tax=Photobacterium alginatilyticum TaxID=1775171 RepID=A0ABW9YRB5_9GAMM|nr:hypothetical protein [Photobacterium alginatilyticum]NBI56248.1 hypothetical protein [Photobacterium alginatilyticum]